MRTDIATLGILAFGALSVGCGAVRHRPVESSFAKFAGVYRFEEQVGPDVYLEGRFVIRPDTIDVELKSATCRLETSEPSVQAITYLCGTDFAISFDRVNPIARVSYRAQVTTPASQTVCTRYVINNGRQVCGGTRRVAYPRSEVRTGRLRPERLDQAEWGTEIASR